MNLQEFIVEEKKWLEKHDAIIAFVVIDCKDEYISEYLYDDTLKEIKESRNKASRVWLMPGERIVWAEQRLNDGHWIELSLDTFARK